MTMTDGSELVSGTYVQCFLMTNMSHAHQHSLFPIPDPSPTETTHNWFLLHRYHEL